MHKTCVLLTGAFGFIGRNLSTHIQREPGVDLISYGKHTPRKVLEMGLGKADVILHLAGINRPEAADEYEQGNSEFTAFLCKELQKIARKPRIIFSSSRQANLDNAYGTSKRRAEEHLMQFGEKTGAQVSIFRLQNVFGKWCRPNYNSVVATFCHNIARGLPISISDSSRVFELVYIDDVCRAMLACSGISLAGTDNLVEPVNNYADITPVFKITLGELAETIKSFRDSRYSLQIPDFKDHLVRHLYATYLSYLERNDLAYDLQRRADNRGYLTEFLKSPSFGQIFVSHTKPGVTRGNHYHHTKAEKFFVLHGQAIVCLRNILDKEIIEYHVSGAEYRVVDIPPGYTHSIENVGNTELVTLFWSDEEFNSESPDTFLENVIID